MSAVVYLEKINATVGDTKIRIGVTKIEEDIVNTSLKIQFPKVSEDKQNTETPVTKYKDLKRLNHFFTVEGFVMAQQSQDADLENYDVNIKVKNDKDTLTASQAKNALIYYILYPFGDINLYWRGLADKDATPETALISLMQATDADRQNTVVFDKIKFTDAPGLRAEHNYSQGAPYDHAEFNAEKYNFVITLTRAVKF